MTSFASLFFLRSCRSVAALKHETGDPRQRRWRVRHHRLTRRHSYSLKVVGPRAKHASRVKVRRRDVEFPETPETLYRLRDQRLVWVCR